jgi:methylase of polypeptide subunit release factors
VEWEDWHALCGGDDGLDVARDIVHFAPSHLLDPTSRVGEVWMELDGDHPKTFATELQSIVGFPMHVVETFEDWYGVNRFIRVRNGNGNGDKLIVD